MLLRKRQKSRVQTLFNRYEVIMDRYFEESLKQGTKEDCVSETGLIVTFDDWSEISPNFISKFLNNATNKTNLSKYLANRFLTYHESKQSILCVTFGDSIISSSEAVFSETYINQCSSKEADPRIVRHAINLEMERYINVQIKIVDSNVVILCLTYADDTVKWNRKFSRSLWSNEQENWYNR